MKNLVIPLCFIMFLLSCCNNSDSINRIDSIRRTDSIKLADSLNVLYKEQLRIRDSLAELAECIRIEKTVDEMDGRIMYLANTSLYIENGMGSEQIIFTFHIEGNTDNNIQAKGLTVFTSGIGGNCVEKSELIILFDDGDKIIKNAWNDFNCDGLSFYNLSKNDLQKLSVKSVSKVRFKNGYNYNSYTSKVEPCYKQYFIRVLQAIKDKNIVLRKVK